MAKRSVEALVLCVALSLGLAACSSSSGKPTDAAVEHAPDVAIDRAGTRLDTGAGSDAHDGALDDGDSGKIDSGAGGKADSGAGGAGIGGMGMGGAGMGGMGMGGAGTGGNGAGGMGMGGSGTGGTGMGGMTTGAGGAGTDAGPDIAPGGSDGGGADAPADVPSPTDGSTDTAPACGVGCPANVDPQDLLLWISADVGVSCDQTTTPPRVTGWKDRRAGSTVTLAPVATKFGPRCDGQTLNGTPLPYFDRTGADINNGILQVDLMPLNQQSYTVFVVERRRAADARFILGTDVPVPAISGCVDENFVNPNALLAYRFGYFIDTVFEAGSYTWNPDDGSCDDPSALVLPFSTSQAALEIDRLSLGNDHSLTAGGTTNFNVVTPPAPMDMLLQGYLGRANQLPSTVDSRYLGEVAEVVIYKVALTSDQVTAVSNYLKGRWNL